MRYLYNRFLGMKNPSSEHSTAVGRDVKYPVTVSHNHSEQPAKKYNNLFDKLNIFEFGSYKESVFAQLRFR